MSQNQDSRRTLVVGTRGSALAKAQAEEALRRLRQLSPGLRSEVRIISTGGDRNTETPLSVIGGQGVFTKEIQSALLSGAIDAAVHSLKDLPPVNVPGLVIAAFLSRADARDALVSRDRLSLSSLPAGARVGTGSARRRAFIKSMRPDLDICEIRGNVDTRLRRVREGEIDAVMLAAAGLARLGRSDEITEIYPEDVILPAPGQGTLAIETRVSDGIAQETFALLDDTAARVCATAERSFLRRLGSGCTRPAAAYARLDGATIAINAALADDEGDALISRRVSGSRDAAAVLGASIASSLLAARV